jgi:hypothetical protein
VENVMNSPIIPGNKKLLVICNTEKHKSQAKKQVYIIKKYDFPQIGLKRSFCHQKCASKAEKQPILAPYRYHIK